MRPVASAAISKLPLPRKGSYTPSPTVVWFRIGRRMHSTGFWVPWIVEVSSREPPKALRLAICQRVVCFRSPAQCPERSRRTAYQQGSCWP